MQRRQHGARRGHGTRLVSGVDTEATLYRLPSAAIGHLDGQQSSVRGMAAPAHVDTPLERADEARQAGRRRSIPFAIDAGREGGARVGQHAERQRGARAEVQQVERPEVPSSEKVGRRPGPGPIP